MLRSALMLNNEMGIKGIYSVATLVCARNLLFQASGSGEPHRKLRLRQGDVTFGRQHTQRLDTTGRSGLTPRVRIPERLAHR